MKRTKQILQPQYMNSFSCIGSACEDTCCAGWRITIDQETYKKYKRVRDPEMKPLFNKILKRNRSNVTKENYARILMDENGVAPCLNKDGLCSIQLKLGEEYLSHTCAVYPRMSSKVNDIWEQSATTSCPEIARLALLNPNRMEFDYISKTIDEKLLKGQKINTENVSNTEKKYFWELRIFVIALLQNREYSIEERLIILGIFCDNIQEYIEEKKINELPNLISLYNQMLNNRLFDKELSNITTNHVVQIKILNQVLKMRLTNIVHKRYIECLKEVSEALGYETEDKPGIDFITRYQTIYQKYYRPFMEQHEYIYENYLVNYVVKNLFPFEDQYTIFGNYQMMVIHYALIKLHLIGMAGYHREDFNPEHIIKLIQSFGRVVEHNSSYLQSVYELLKKNNYNTMLYMAMLIKN
ncbi:flagellin lysine-N-methylase [Aneurinibacillus sp. BA2021]|nr:flagellin lysine-N-methylase [Aneurinibacillus sp. BA2021]